MLRQRLWSELAERHACHEKIACPLRSSISGLFDGGDMMVHMHEMTRCRAVFQAIDATQTLLHMASLETPMGTYPKATVRAGDLLLQ